MTLLAVERIKLATTRSPWWLALLTLAAAAGSAALSNDRTVASTQGFYRFGLVIMMVIAALAVTTEYRFGTIRSTFLAMPDRTDVLVAKTAVVALVAGVVGELAAFSSWGLAVLLKPAADLRIDTAAEWRQVAGVGLVYLVAAVLAVAVATLVRQTAGAVVILLVYPLLVENLIPLIPTVGPNVQPWLPLTAANHFLTAGMSAPADGHGPPVLDLPYGPWGSLGYCAGVALVLLAVAIRVAERRDA